MSAKILVTGGSGFIGTNLIDYCLSNKMEVKNIDIKQPRNQNHFRYWEKADIRNYDGLKKIIKDFKPTYVVHLAARADLTGKSLEDYSSNTIGVRNIVNVCNEVSSIGKVMFTSTQLVCRGGYVPKDDNDYCPPNLYGESKMIGEKLVKDASDKLRYKWVIMRPTSIWGPWFGPTYRGFFELILKRRYFNYTGKMATKTYGYIGNTIYQIDRLLKADDNHGKTFYLGDYKPTKIKEWAQEIGGEINYSVINIPRSIIWCSAKVGDFLKQYDIKFPMNSYRYNNMLTDSVMPLEETRKYAPDLPYDRIEGNRLTIKWMFDYYLK